MTLKPGACAAQGPAPKASRATVIAASVHRQILDIFVVEGGASNDPNNQRERHMANTVVSTPGLCNRLW